MLENILWGQNPPFLPLILDFGNLSVFVHIWAWAVDNKAIKEFFMSDLGVDGDVLNFDTPLFGDEIGLDSVDSLEIISFVDDNFGVSMTGVGKEHFQSIDTIAAFIENNKA